MDEETLQQIDEGVVVRKGRFIEKNKDAGRVLQKRCKRCGTVLTFAETDYGSFKLWCVNCDTYDLTK